MVQQHDAQRQLLPSKSVPDAAKSPAVDHTSTEVVPMPLQSVSEDLAGPVLLATAKEDDDLPEKSAERKRNDDLPGNNATRSKRSATEAGLDDAPENAFAFELDSFAEYFSVVERNRELILAGLDIGKDAIFYCLSSPVWSDTVIKAMMTSIRDHFSRVFFRFEDYDPKMFSVTKRVRADSHAYFVYASRGNQREPVFCATLYPALFPRRHVRVGIEMKARGKEFLKRLK